MRHVPSWRIQVLVQMLTNGSPDAARAHLKAIGFTSEAQPLLDAAGVEADDKVIDLTEGAEAFTTAACGRAWDREPAVRMLA